MSDPATLYRDGLAAAQAGDRARARELLSQYVQQERENEHAWFWLGSVLDDPAQQRECLGRVLALNPNNQQAIQALQRVIPPTPTPTRATQPAVQYQPAGPPPWAVDAFEKAVAAHIKVGYRITFRTATSVQLVRPKQFDVIVAFFWFLVLFVGLFFYLLYYLGKQDEVLLLELLPDGQIRKTVGK